MPVTPFDCNQESLNKFIEDIEKMLEENDIFHCSHSLKLTTFREFPFLASPMSIIANGHVPHGELFNGGMARNYGLTYTCFGYQKSTQYNLTYCLNNYSKPIIKPEEKIKERIEEKSQEYNPSIREMIVLFTHFVELNGYNSEAQELKSKIDGAADKLINIYNLIANIGIKFQFTQQANDYNYSFNLNYEIDGDEMIEKISKEEVKRFKLIEEMNCSDPPATVDHEQKFGDLESSILTGPTNTIIDKLIKAESLLLARARKFAERLVKDLEGYKRSLEQFTIKYKPISSSTPIRYFPMVFISNLKTGMFKEIQNEFRPNTNIPLSATKIIVPTKEDKAEVEKFLTFNNILVAADCTRRN